MKMSLSVWCMVKWILVISFVLGVFGKYPNKVYISEECSKEVLFNDSVIFGLHKEKQKLSTPYQCDVVVMAEQRQRLIVHLTSLNLTTSQRCYKSKLTVRNTDGNMMTGNDGICGTSATSSAYFTSGPYAWIHFEVNSSKPNSQNFEIIITAFKDNCSDTKGLFKCSSGRCIAGKLKCDGHDNCGDNSDEKDCKGLSALDIVWIGVAVGICVLVAVCVTVRFLVLRWRNKQKYEDI